MEFNHFSTHLKTVYADLYSKLTEDEWRNTVLPLVHEFTMQTESEDRDEEVYDNGYDEGYRAGWDEAVEAAVRAVESV